MSSDKPPPPTTALDRKVNDLLSNLNRSGAVDRIRKAIEHRIADAYTARAAAISKATDQFLEQVKQRDFSTSFNQPKSKLLPDLLKETKVAVVPPNLKSDIQKDIDDVVKGPWLTDMLQKELDSLDALCDPVKLVDTPEKNLKSLNQRKPDIEDREKFLSRIIGGTSVRKPPSGKNAKRPPGKHADGVTRAKVDAVTPPKGKTSQVRDVKDLKRPRSRAGLPPLPKTAPPKEPRDSKDSGSSSLDSASPVPDAPRPVPKRPEAALTTPCDTNRSLEPGASSDDDSMIPELPGRKRSVDAARKHVDDEPSSNTEARSTTPDTGRDSRRRITSGTDTESEGSEKRPVMKRVSAGRSAFADIAAALRKLETSRDGDDPTSDKTDTASKLLDGTDTGGSVSVESSPQKQMKESSPSRDPNLKVELNPNDKESDVKKPEGENAVACCEREVIRDIPLDANPQGNESREHPEERRKQSAPELPSFPAAHEDKNDTTNTQPKSSRRDDTCTRELQAEAKRGDEFAADLRVSQLAEKDTSVTQSDLLLPSAKSHSLQKRVSGESTGERATKNSKAARAETNSGSLSAGRKTAATTDRSKNRAKEKGGNPDEWELTDNGESVSQKHNQPASPDKLTKRPKEDSEVLLQQSKRAGASSDSEGAANAQKRTSKSLSSRDSCSPREVVQDPQRQIHDISDNREPKKKRRQDHADDYQASRKTKRKRGELADDEHLRIRGKRKRSKERATQKYEKRRRKREPLVSEKDVDPDEMSRATTAKERKSKSSDTETGNNSKEQNSPNRGWIPHSFEARSVPEDYEQQRKILQAMRELMEQEYAEPFLEPVDADDEGCTSYYEEIKNPMDLGTISRRLEEATPERAYYANSKAVMADIELVWSNCQKFNRVYDPVYHDGEKCAILLTAALTKYGADCANDNEGQRRRSRTKSAKRKFGAVRTTDPNNESQRRKKTKSNDDNDGHLVGSMITVFTPREPKKVKTWTQVEVLDFNERSKSYKVKWLDNGKVTSNATFGLNKLYPVYRH